MHDDRVHHIEGPKGESVGPDYTFFARGYGHAAVHVPTYYTKSSLYLMDQSQASNLGSISYPCSVGYNSIPPSGAHDEYGNAVKNSNFNTQASPFACLVGFHQSWF